MFSKVDVNGDDEAPLYTFLKGQQPGEGETSDITWNFEKFLVDKSGNVVKRYAPPTSPEEVAADLDGLR
jgi:glutathione peroxidase